jgi:hypothetical protein
VGRRVEQDKGGAELQELGKRPAAEITRAAERVEEIGPEEDEGGPRCNFIEMQGPYCNSLITFKPGHKCTWAQKKKCMVFQNIHFFFKVHPQKS